jgi:hypothetical protein
MSVFKSQVTIQGGKRFGGVSRLLVIASWFNG